MWLGALILAIILLCASMAIKYQQKSWLAPSTFFGGILSISLIFTLFVLPNAYYNIYAFSWYMISILIFWLGDITGNSISQIVTSNNNIVESNPNIYRLEYFNNIMLISTLLGSLSIVVIIYNDGGSLISLLSVDSLMSTAREKSLERYEDRAYKEPLLSLILMIFAFIANLLGGFTFALSSKKRQGRLSLLALLPNFLTGMILTTRASLLVGIILFLSSFLCTKISTNNGRLTFINVKSILRTLLAVSILISSLIVFRILRSGKLENFNYDYISDAFNNIFSLIFGSIPAFNIWFVNAIEQGLDTLTLGSISFGGPLSLFGIERNAFPSVYFGGGYPETTIHSIFGALISDFSFLGAIVFLYLLGVIAGFLFALAKKNNLRYGMFLVPIYIYLSGFLINSSLKFNNVNLAIVIFILIVTRKISKLRKTLPPTDT